MQVYYSLDDLPEIRNAVVTTGSFDGVHEGHKKIFSRIVQLAEAYEGPSVVITFDPHPREVIYPKDNTLRLLSSIQEKLRLLEQQGIDIVVVLPFTIEFSQMRAREYVEEFLARQFNPACVVVGYDHRFGLNREGDYDLLSEYADNGWFDVAVIEKREVDDIAVSSSKIRKAVAAGQIALANSLLGHHYGMQGVVIHGEKIGSKIGFPTANIKVDDERKLLPPPGIYAVYVFLDEVKYRGMLYIGTRPTVSRTGEVSIEVHIFDFGDRIYNEPIRVEFAAFIRHDKQLANLEELSQMLSKDRDTVVETLESIEYQTPEETLMTVVILNYNGDQVLRKYLPEVIATSGDHKIAVIDNHSTDNSISVIAALSPEIEIIQLDKNHGYAGGYNAGLKFIKSRYYVLLNSDVRPSPGWLEPLLHCMQSDSSIAACQPRIRADKEESRFEYAGAAGGFIDVLGYPFCAGRIFDDIEEDSGQYEDIDEIFWASGAALAIRSDAFEALGGFDPDFFAHMEEIDLCWRLRRAGYAIKAVQDSIVYHLGGATLKYGSARKVFLNFRNNWAMLIKNHTGRRLLWVIPVRLLLDIAAALQFAVKLRFPPAWAIIRAHAAILFSVPSLLRKRRRAHRIAEAAQTGTPSLRTMFNGSLVVSYYLKGQRTFSQIKTSWNGVA